MWIMFINGPLAGRLSEVDEAQDNYYAMDEPSPFASFAHATDMMPSAAMLAQRVTYYKISGTTHPIKYVTDTYNRAQEIINFVRHLGFTLTDSQERMMRYWFGPAKVGDTQDDSA